ncbi:MAG: DUF6639 family protein [Halopseudomonas sp.]
MRITVKLGLGVLLSAMLSSGTLRAESCSGLGVEILSPLSPKAHSALCDSVAATLIFLKPLQLVVTKTLYIEVVQRPLVEQGHAIFGSYDAVTDRITVMSQAAIMEQDTSALMYGQPFESDHYRGVIAHEVTHAVVQQYVADLNHTAQEYLAHAAQLAVLPESRRRQIIGFADVDPWRRDDVISDIYMAMALTKFAVKCYLHLTEHLQPVQLVQMLLASKWRFVVVVI